MANQAYKLSENGQYKQALETVKRAANVNQEIINLVRNAFRNEEFEPALEMFQDGMNALSNLRLGSIYYALGYYSDAIVLLRKSIDSTRSIERSDRPEFARALNSLAVTYLGIGNYGEAIKLLQESITIIEKACQRFFGEAPALSKVVLEADSTVALAYNNLIVAYSLTGEYSKAYDISNAAVERYQRLGMLTA